MVERYILVSHKQISTIQECGDCNGRYHIEERTYHDTWNEENKDNLHNTSVRTACLCTKEIDPYIERNKHDGLEDTNILTSHGYRSVRAKND